MSDTAHELPQEFIVLRYNHFDPIWRRCWDRDFHDAGRHSCLSLFSTPPQSK
ncbi:MAG TPA: hypothetical protein VM223_08580 [Planctomycetota bacterium]|nr:hypothetical protein [Planctomycetota bacterium]